MNKILISTLSLLLVTGVVARAESPAPPVDWPKQYSADMVVTTEANGGTKYTTKIFVDGPKTRTEMDVNGMKNVAIILSDKKMMYSLMPGQKMYMEMPMTTPPGQVDETAKWELLGSELVEGKDCLKYRATTMAYGRTNSVLYWLSKADKMPVRMATEDGKTVTDWTHFQKGAQDPSLFNLPSDYKKMTMPGPGSMTMPGQ